MNINKFNDFRNLYQLSKTLRFELIPQGKTLDNIRQHGLIAQDEQRAKDYQQVKKIIDDYHKAFIDEALANAKLENLQSYYELYVDKSNDDKKQLENIKKELRKKLIAAVTSNDKFKNIDKEELIKEDLINWVKDQSNRQQNESELINKFRNFTTYFKGFHDNRKNMYSEEEKSTSIAFRLIHQNLPKFIDNLQIFEKVKSSGIDLSSMSLLLGDVPLEDFFKLEYFNQTLTQRGIEFYNKAVGGKSNDDGSKLQGLNELINLYNQQQDDKKNRLPKLKPLFKQILSDREGYSFVLESFKNDGDVCSAINKFYDEKLKTSDGIFERLPTIFNQINEYDTKQIYINKSALTNLSAKLYGSWDVISKALEFYYITQIDKDSGKNKASISKKEKWLASECFSVYLLDDVIRHYLGNKQIDEGVVTQYLVDYFAKIFTESSNIIVQITNQYSTVQAIIQNIQPDTKNLIQEKENVAEIKKLLDLIMELLHLYKIFVIKTDIAEKEHSFYSELEYCLELLNPIIALYNQTRNYLTQKPYTLEKFKLNFDKSSLLSGWSQSYENKGGMIFIKDNNYYLAILNKKFSNEEILFLKDNFVLNPAERVVYDFQKPDNKNIPRLFIRSKGDKFAPAVEKYNLPIYDIIDIYDSGKFKTEFRSKNPEEYNISLTKLIDYFKVGFSKHESYKHYEFTWKNSNLYNDISEFYHDVECSCYQLFYETVNFQHLLDYVDEGKLYLFQIYNKDFSPHSTGTPNMHTLYWKALFSEENLANVIYKLNGQAEIFYRKKSITADKTIKHLAHQPINNKNIDNGKKQSTFAYDLVKDKRFTVDKFQFHVPITLNFKAQGRDDINLEVKEYLKANPQTNVIGIDRGERHLLYVSVVNPSGEIIRQFSLNEIINEYKGATYKVDYHNLLKQKGNEREIARKDWGVVENIKELKEGYLSQVVHKLCQLVIEYQAIIVMEDLNSGFKNSRIKVEKQVYQPFEKMLIDKLQYLAFKNPQENQPSIYGALQLASKFESFTELEKRKQSGFIFYVPAWNTSKIDPATGFVDLLKPKEFIRKFDEIKYNQAKDWFEFSFDYSKFTEKAAGTRLNWTVCTTNINRYSWNRKLNNGKGEQQLFEITKYLKALFDNYKINYQTSENLVAQIAIQAEKDFYVCLLKYLSITLSLRHNNDKSGIDEEDYIVSPVADNSGAFFDSRVEIAKGKDKNGNWISKLSVDADANGAYHIAKKGLWVLQQLRKSDDLRKVKLAISNKEWLEFTQN
jgi:CRISPR-associated protein Cpf1